MRRWYGFAAAVIHPDRAMDEPLVNEMPDNPVHHWPMIVRFLPTNVLVWPRLLEHLTRRKVRAPTAGELQKAWEHEVAGLLVPKRHAAE